jgi:lipopolysaccharide transport system ATP-binding protein
VSDVVISASGVSKRYRIGAHQRYKTLRESLVRVFGATARRFLGSGPEDPRSVLWALRDVDFEVRAGEVLGLIGRNGAGKSTLLKLLSRITEPTEGRIELVGRVGSLLEIGTGFHPELTGRENIFLNGSILGMRRREIVARFDEIVEFAEMQAFLDTPVKRYSSGMFVRLAFAVAAHLESEILLIDEVLAVGDAAFQRKCLGKVRDVARRGRTVVFVSHNMAAIRQLTDTGLWIDRGRVAARGPTADVVEQYHGSLRHGAQTSVEVDDTVRGIAMPGRPVEFLRLELAGRERPVLRSDEEILLRVTLRARASVDRFRLNAVVSRADGSAVGSCFGPESLQLAAGETAEFDMRLCDLRLSQGLYQLTLGVGTGTQLDRLRQFDIVRDVLPFEVVSPDSEYIPTRRTDWGPIRFPAPDVKRVS